MADEVTPTTRKAYKQKKKWLKNEKSKNIATAVSLLGVLGAVTGYALHKPIDYNGLTPKVDVSSISPMTNNGDEAKNNSSGVKTPTPSNTVKKINKNLEDKVKKTDNKIRAAKKTEEERTNSATKNSTANSNNNAGGENSIHTITPPTIASNDKAKESNSNTASTPPQSTGVKTKSTPTPSSSKSEDNKVPNPTAVKSSSNNSTIKKSSPSVTSKPSSTTVSTINLVLDANYVADKSQIMRSNFKITPPTNYVFNSPVSTKLLSSQYGYNSMGAFHSGVDYKVDCGDNVYSSADGVVENVGDINSYGKRIMIKHSGNVYTTYSQLSEIKVNVGDHIKAGQVIGSVGTDGSATTCELHFETAVNGSFVNPLNYINHKVSGEQSIIKAFSIFYGPNYKPSASSTVDVKQKNSSE